jgi:hypothetical protein
MIKGTFLNLVYEDVTIKGRYHLLFRNEGHNLVSLIVDGKKLADSLCNAVVTIETAEPEKSQGEKWLEKTHATDQLFFNKMLARRVADIIDRVAVLEKTLGVKQEELNP